MTRRPVFLLSGTIRAGTTLMAMLPARTRDIVCMGASLGGVSAFQRVLSQLPGDFPAAVFIVQHQAEVSGSRLAQVLGV